MLTITGAVYGQIAGAYYGAMSGIPENGGRKFFRALDIEVSAECLYNLAQKTPKNPAVKAYRTTALSPLVESDTNP